MTINPREFVDKAQCESILRRRIAALRDGNGYYPTQFHRSQAIAAAELALKQVQMEAKNAALS
jgi:hypothetical protein